MREITICTDAQRGTNREEKTQQLYFPLHGSSAPRCLGIQAMMRCGSGGGSGGGGGRPQKRSARSEAHDSATDLLAASTTRSGASDDPRRKTKDRRRRYDLEGFPLWDPEALFPTECRQAMLSPLGVAPVTLPEVVWT